MSKIDEMVETFVAATLAEGRQVSAETSRIGLRAVLEKHVKAMVATAFKDGGACETGGFEGVSRPDIWPEPDEYAERVISDLTDQPNRNDRAV